MPELGYAISSEEHAPADLVRNAQRAEEVGFPYALISDHFHPWVDAQGHSPFVWSVIGAIAHTTKRLRLGTGVTCPLIRMHPAIVAHAAATSAVMMPGRFFLGLGSGELLNEHVTGERWPFDDERQDMLEEAVEVIRKLWAGDDGYTYHRGRYYRVEKARLYTRPDEPPPIAIAAGGPRAAELAARLEADLIATSPDEELVSAFRKAGGKGDVYGQMTVCWAKSEEDAKRTAHEIWPNAAIPLTPELATPEEYGKVAEQLVTADDVAKDMALGPDPEPFLKLIGDFDRAGFTHVYLHQVGPDQNGFFDFFERELKPQV